MRGRGKPLRGVLGGPVTGAIYNGVFLKQFGPELQYIVTGQVRLAAIIVDSTRAVTPPGAASRAFRADLTARISAQRIRIVNGLE